MNPVVSEILDMVFVKLQSHILVVLVMLLNKYVDFGKILAASLERDKSQAEDIARIDKRGESQASDISRIDRNVSGIIVKCEELGNRMEKLEKNGIFKKENNR